MNLEEKLSEANVKPFEYCGVPVFSLDIHQLRNLVAHILEINASFTFDWERKQEVIWKGKKELLTQDEINECLTSINKENGSDFSNPRDVQQDNSNEKDN